MRTYCIYILSCFLLVSVLQCPVDAYSGLTLIFQKKYVDTNSHEEFKAAFKAQKCNVCHIKGEKKSVCNAYGKALNLSLRDLAGDADLKEMSRKDKEKFAELAVEALDTVAKEKKAEDCPTFGELIESGKLP